MHSEVTGWCKITLTVVTAVGAVLAWHNWPVPRTDLDRAIVRGWGQAVNGDVTEIVASHLPNDFHMAVRGLRRLGFTAGNRTVGVIHRRQPVPEVPLVSKADRGSFVHFNRVLDEYDAVLVRPFYRSIPGTIPGAFFRGPGVHLYLFMKEDGSMALSSNAIYSAFFP